MVGVPTAKRTAHFKTLIALASPEKILFTVEGICPGRIITEMRGSHGFGYDPVFLYEPLHKTFAELSAEEKNQVSHRARALSTFKQALYNNFKL
jgi:XTP/dITP diphosphohydrolase